MNFYVDIFAIDVVLYFGSLNCIGDWSNGMTEVSKTFSGSSILSSPVPCFPGMPILCGFPGFLFLQKIICSINVPHVPLLGSISA